MSRDFENFQDWKYFLQFWCVVLQAVVWRRFELGRLCYHCTPGTTASIWSSRLLLPYTQSEQSRYERWKCERNCK